MTAVSPRPPSAEETFRLAKERLIRKAPPPLLWMFGKTQSGKSSIIRFLTGVADISIGLGFRPTTKQSTLYDFPTSDGKLLLRFVDTRGLGEVKYDPAEDLAQVQRRSPARDRHRPAHRDMALEAILEPLRRIRAAQPQRPILPRGDDAAPRLFAEAASALSVHAGTRSNPRASIPTFAGCASTSSGRSSTASSTRWCRST